MRKFAFILMGPQFHPEIHQAAFETPGMCSFIRTARNFEEAKEEVLRLAGEGDGAIEICDPERARELIALTKNQVAIGYVTHFEEQNRLFDLFFGKAGEHSEPSRID